VLHGLLIDVNQPRQRDRDRHAEELDDVVAQLNNISGLGPAPVGADRRLGGAGGRDVEGGGVSDVAQRPLIMEGTSDDEDVAPAPDGTLLASTPARPL